MRNMEKPFQFIPPWLFQGRPRGHGMERIEEAKAAL